MMKLIIAGGRDFDDYLGLRVVMFDYDFDDLEIVCGLARGADALGKRFADENELPLKLFPADWDQFGKAAGVIRNRAMAGYADVLVAFWDGKSRGTKNMIALALREGLEVHVFRYGA